MKTWAEKLVDSVRRDRETHPERWEGAPPLFGPPVDLSGYPLAAGVNTCEQAVKKSVNTCEHIEAVLEPLVNIANVTGEDALERRRAYRREWMRKRREKA